MRKLTLEEAIYPYDEVERAGLMHLLANFAGMPNYVMCNCCNDCCTELTPVIASGRLGQKALTFELVRPPDHIPVGPPAPYVFPFGLGWVRQENLK